MIKKIPVAMASLILSIFALGNLLGSYSLKPRTGLFILGLVLYLAYLTRFLGDMASLKKIFNDPLGLSVLPSFTMATMLLAGFLKAYIGDFARWIYLLGLLGHGLLILVFSYKFILRDFSLDKIYTSSFIVYVGIVVGSLVGPNFSYLRLAQYIFYFGLLSYPIILVLVAFRIFKGPEIERPKLATNVILAAPASLLIAGYLSSFNTVNLKLVYLLYGLSLFFYLIGLVLIVKYSRMGFMPSFSAFTFPMVISGLASKLTKKYFMENSLGFKLSYLIKFQELVALLVVFSVLISYLRFLSRKE